QTGEDVCLERLNPDGTRDATFGSGGVVVTAAPTGDEARAVNLQSDGQIVVVGGEYTVDANGTAGPWEMMAARYNANGSLAASFGVNGYAVAPSGNGRGAADGVAIDPDGRIVLAGTFYREGIGADSFALARFVAYGPQIGSFTDSPNSVTAGSSLTLTASSITDANPNGTITQVAFYVDSNNDGALEPGADTLLGHAARTSPGVWTLTFTVNEPPGTYTLFAQAEDSYGVFGNPALLTLTIQ